MKTLLYSVFQHDFRHTDSDIRPVFVRKLLEKPLGIFGPVFVFGFPEIETAPGPVGQKGGPGQARQGRDIKAQVIGDDSGHAQQDGNGHMGPE